VFGGIWLIIQAMKCIIGIKDVIYSRYKGNIKLDK
jgi:hypothetical protein